jgi:hypothetical protein
MIPMGTTLTPNAQLLIWGSVIILLATAGCFLAMVLRRSMTTPSQQISSPPGFTLSDLQRMHDEGKISDEEFNRAKAKMIATVRSTLVTPPSRPDQSKV